MKLPLLTLSIFIFTSLTSQITIVNQSNSSIKSVHLHSSNNSLLTISNKKGVVNWSQLENISLTDTIYFSHVSYNSKWIIKSNITKTDTIVLIDKNHNLSEMSVTANKKYQKINACYRSYQTNNDSLIYYTDGIADYVTKIGKNKYQKRIKEHRAYEDSSYTSNIKDKSIKITFRIAGTSRPLTEYIPKKYFKRRDLNIKPGLNGGMEIFTNNNIKIGSIKKDSNFVTYFINDIFSTKTRKLPKYEAIQLKTEITLVFKLSEDSDTYLITNFNNLVYSKVYRKYDFKRDTDKDYTEIQGVSEIFVQNIRFSNEIEAEKYSKGFGFPRISNYSSLFWKNCKCSFFYPPPFTFFDTE